MIDLNFVVQNYSDCLSSRSRLKALLADLYPVKNPAEKRQINLTMTVFDSGIAAQIKDAAEIDAPRMNAFIRLLVDEYGLNSQAAREGIQIWADAWGIKLYDTTSAGNESHSSDIPVKRIVQPVAPSSRAAAPASADFSDFKIQKGNQGWYISKFVGPDKPQMVIPGVIDGKQIVGIGKDAFRGCSRMTELTISEGIEYIENGAFYQCKALQVVTFPDTLRRTGGLEGYVDGAFAMTGIRTLKIPALVQCIGGWAFSSCYNLESVEMGESIEEIGENAFHNCGHLRTLSLSSKLKVIPRGAFSDCKSLKKVHLPAGLLSIEELAFYNCAELNAIYIPPTVTKIADDSSIPGNAVFGFWTSNLTIYCTAGSAAMEYARKHGIKYAKGIFK